MSDLKKGDRVRHKGWGDGTLVEDVRSKESGEIGALMHVDEDGLVFAGRTEFAWASNLTLLAPPAPRFEDVRTGDKITVEVDGVTISGPVRVRYSDEIHMGERLSPVIIVRTDGRWQEYRSTLAATLTAHEPAEPAWHRAKVIKADHPANCESERTDYLINKGSLGFVNAYGVHFQPDKLTNVTIIVDENGVVVS
jgi:hypothetical protein